MCTRTTLAIRSLVRQNKAEGALAEYIDRFDVLTGRTVLEWQLAESIGSGTGAVRAPASWPEAMLARPSGAALVFIVAQRTRTPCPRPLPLFPPQVMPAGMRRLLAQVWAEHPMCEALRDASARRAFARQLIADPLAIEPVLDAVLHLDDPELIAEVAGEWLRHPLAVERAAMGALQRLARHEQLHAICREAVAVRIAAARANGDELVQLAEILAALRDDRAVVAVSDVARGRDITGPSRRRLLALRLAALAELDAAEQLVEEYRRDWIPSGAAYPAPEELLYILHVNGANDAIEHLLATRPENSPRWIHLWRRTVMTKPLPAADIAEWVALCRGERKDDAPLFGLTEAILAATVATRAQERDTVTWVRGVWAELLRRGQHELSARVYLVLLEQGDPDIIRTFEEWFSEDVLATHPARRAAVSYVRALSRLRLWAKLRAFLDRVPAEHLRTAFGAHELETHTLMADLEHLPDGRSLAGDEWLAAWERLLALPLDTRQISDVLRRFTDLTATLRQRGSDVVSAEHFEDVHLQVLRRGCAEAERLLVAGNLSPDEIAERRARLSTSELPAVDKVIDELRLRVT